MEEAWTLPAIWLKDKVSNPSLLKIGHVKPGHCACQTFFAKKFLNVAFVGTGMSIRCCKSVALL